jgi:putative transposase
MIAPSAELSVNRQCQLLGIARSSYYYQPSPASANELDLLHRLDRIFTEHPVYGARRLRAMLLREGISVGRRRIRRLMRKLGLSAIRPKRDTSKAHPEHKVYPYLLRDKTIDQPNQVWASDITYIPMRRGFLYLVAIIAWATAGPESSIPIRARSSPATRSPGCFSIMGSRSAWMGAGAATTISSSSVYGGR